MINEYKYNLKDTISYSERINFFIYIILTLTPFAYFKNPVYSISMPKMLFLIFITTIIIIMRLLIIEKPSRKRVFEDQLVLLYMGLIILSTLFSPDLLNSIFGHTRRYE